LLARSPPRPALFPRHVPLLLVLSSLFTSCPVPLCL
jgi:hypothetical protein